MQFITIQQAKREAQVSESGVDDDPWFNDNVLVAKSFIENKIEGLLFESQADIDAAKSSNNPPNAAFLIDPLINKVAAMLVADWFSNGAMSTPDGFFDMLSHLKPDYSA